ncbi:MAG: xanthine dehydrogenase family protein subunit M [Pseudohongiellaceae bacterium]
MYEFTYHRAITVAEAVAKLAASGDGKFLAGGQTMLPTMKHRLASPEDLIDLGAIADLHGIDVDARSVTIGAMTRHAEVASHPGIIEKIPSLANLAGHIGDPAVRNRGTLGGSIANNDPAADYPAAIVALAATVVTNQREIPGDDFFTDMFETALAEDELILRVRFPIPQAAAYAKFDNPASRYAVVGVFVASTGEAIRVAVTGAAPCVHRALQIEEALRSGLNPDAIDAVNIDAGELNSDIHASADYRAHLVKVLAKRAVVSCL